MFVACFGYHACFHFHASCGVRQALRLVSPELPESGGSRESEASDRCMAGAAMHAQHACDIAHVMSGEYDFYNREILILKLRS